MNGWTEVEQVQMDVLNLKMEEDADNGEGTNAEIAKDFCEIMCVFAYFKNAYDIFPEFKGYPREIVVHCARQQFDSFTWLFEDVATELESE